jgi:hypothetical protein
MISRPENEKDPLASAFAGLSPRAQAIISQEVIHQAAEAYRTYKRGGSLLDFADFLDRHPSLSASLDKEETAIRMVRKIVDAEPKEPLSLPKLAVPSRRNRRSRRGQKAEPTGGRREGGADANSPFWPIRVPEDAGNIPPNERAVHLTNSRAVNTETVQSILNSAPQVVVIQTSPSLGDQMVGPGIENLISHQPGVELRIGRIRDHAFYDEGHPPADYYKKLAIYERMRLDPAKSNLFGRMLDKEMVEAVTTEAFFKGGQTSARRVAQELGFSVRYTGKKLSVGQHWIGIESKNQAVISAAAALPKRLAYLEKAEENRREREALRASFAVGDQLPPESLFFRHWETWQRTQQLLAKEPQALDKLSPEQSLALTRYYQIGPFEGEPSTLEQIGRELNRTREMARLYKAQALTRLGLLEEP